MESLYSNPDRINTQRTRNNDFDRFVSLNNSSVLTKNKTLKLKPLISLTQKNCSIAHLRKTDQGDAVGLAEEYGEMLPKTGIYALPDFKITGFLKILNDYHDKLMTEHRYLEAKDSKGKFKELCQIEFGRCVRKMQERQTMELEKIENI